MSPNRESTPDTGLTGKHFVFVLGHLGSLGGAERQAMILARSLRDHVDARVSFVVLGSRPGIVSEMLDAAGIPWSVCPISWSEGLFSKVLSLFKFAVFLRITVKPDFLLPYIGENCKIVGCVWRFTGAHYTWWNQRDEGRGIFGSRLDRWVIKTLPDVVSNSWEGRDFLVRTFGIPKERVRVINNAVLVPPRGDPSVWRARLGLAADEILVVMVANLTRFKDHASLLKAFHHVVSRHAAPPCRLVLAGRDGGTADALKVLAFDLRLVGNVEFPGMVQDVNSLYAAADLVAHSSKLEGCPNGVLEAMALGKCVVGTDISGLRQALGDDAAEECLAPPDDPLHLGELMARFVDSSDLRQEWGERNLRRIRREFSVERHVEQVLEGIRRFIQPPNPQPNRQSPR